MEAPDMPGIREALSDAGKQRAMQFNAAVLICLDNRLRNCSLVSSEFQFHLSKTITLPDSQLWCAKFSNAFVFHFWDILHMVNSDSPDRTSVLCLCILLSSFSSYLILSKDSAGNKLNNDTFLIIFITVLCHQG